MRNSWIYVMAFVLAIASACMSLPDDGDAIDQSELAITSDEQGALNSVCTVTELASPLCDAAERVPPEQTTNACHTKNGCTWCVEGNWSCMVCPGWQEPRCQEGTRV